MQYRRLLGTTLFSTLLACSSTGSTDVAALQEDPNHTIEALVKIPIDTEWRLDGVGNNSENPAWGSSGTTLLRAMRVSYDDGSESPAGANRASARAISNAVAAQESDMPNTIGASDFVWQWGQFLDHDIDLTHAAEPAEPFNISVPQGDVDFDPFSTGAVSIPLNRSEYIVEDGVRQQVNSITSFIDASNVYGSNDETAAALRTLDGTGRLRTSDGDLLPFDDSGLFFLAGDVRANEQVGLISMHTLFVREHNFWVDRLASIRPNLDGDALYASARRIVAAEMQAITFEEFLPVLLGRQALRPYKGYKPNVNAGIANIFSTAAYRLGHSMLSSTLLRLDANGNAIEEGHLALQDAFFNPAEVSAHGIEPYLRGLAAQQAQEVDNKVVDDVRNFLFGPPGAGGFDLASLNIQRGRDHGLPSYNQARRDLGLEEATNFADVTSDEDVQAQLASVYESVEDIDVWVGGLAEDHLPKAMVGELFSAVLSDQFERLRDGDRRWYKTLPRRVVRFIEEQTLSTIIRRNTDIGRELPNNVFLPNALDGLEHPDQHRPQPSQPGQGREDNSTTGGQSPRPR